MKHTKKNFKKILGKMGMTLGTIRTRKMLSQRKKEKTVKMMMTAGLPRQTSRTRRNSLQEISEGNRS
jgi:hypothetical protein